MSNGLWLTRLRLAQFRSHARAELALAPGLVAIFGPNGAGKTNILEAVSLLSPGRGLRRAAAAEMARRQAAAGWRIRAELSAGGVMHEIVTEAAPGAARTVQIDGKPAPQTALSRLLAVLWLVPVMDRLWVEGAEGRRRFLDRATMSLIPDHAELSIAWERAMRERNRLLKDMVRDWHWYEALEAQMATAGAAIHRNRMAALEVIGRAQAADTAGFPAARLSLVQGSPACDDPADAEALRAALAASREADLRAGRTLVGPHRADLEAVYAEKDSPARDCSTGEQKALLISLVLANARAIAEQRGQPPILLLDEVAAHLDADRRAALYDALSALGAQVLMTGTGRELFAPLAGRAQLVEVVEQDGASRIIPEKP